ncbi:MAG: hypothetical protein C0423_01860 [Methylibium sp.]|nr:hypothetical protein [Methylibium sp.]
MSRSPRACGTEHLTVTLGARLPASVAALWRAEAAAAGLCISDWLRQAIDPGRVRVTGRRKPGQRIARRQADPTLIEAVGRWGGNLNQIAHLANTGALANRPVDVLRTLVQIEQHLRALLDMHIAAVVTEA